MKFNRRDIIGGMVILITIGLACYMPALASEHQSEAEATLQAIHIQQSVEALASSAESVPSDVPAEPTVPVSATLQETDEEVSTEIPPEPTATREIVHNTIPGEPGWVSQWQLDTVSSSSATQKRANGGDFLNQNRLERPFTANEMLYHPEIDLGRVEISKGSTFYFFILHLSGLDEAENLLSAYYGVEIDTDRDGRGDFLIWAQGDGLQQWNIDNVYLYTDSNDDVGDSRPMRADAPGYSGDGYDRLLFSPMHLNDPDMAWKRVDPANGHVIQLAVKRSAIGNASTFLWNAWADAGVRDPAQMDYNDVYTLNEAGSPLSSSEAYPLKALALTDNTCRLAYGFEPDGDEPGLCPLAVPTSPPPTNEPTAVPQGCDCPSYPNYTFIDSEECCVECGFVWYGTSEFPCGLPVAPPPCNCSSFPNYTFITDSVCCAYCGFTWTGSSEFPCIP